MLASCLLALGFAAGAPRQETVLRPGLVITKSAKIKRQAYSLPNGDDTGKTAAITIRGDNITVDFNLATLRGTPANVEPDQRKGTAIIVQGKNVTVRGLIVRGYRNGLVAIDSPGVKVFDSDFSYNYKPRLASTPEREDTSDWMSFHKNEQDEWLREKAPAIYIRRSDRFEIRGNRCTGGQTALMITDSKDGLVWNNDFSFLSAVGIAMYRASANRIMHNKLDWCLRGFSFGVYNRGQDSAAILVYEQSSNNVFAYNSATHSGDGFFLWAGQTTMDTGKGGSNDNLLYANDFSHAPTNGIEATFSRNKFIGNLVLETWHGIWGGYSWQSQVIGNVFGYNTEAISWEHGQDNLISRNTFWRDNEAIVLWSNPTQDPSWGYAKTRDTKSRDWTITSNNFGNIRANVFRIRRTENVRIENNTITNPGKVLSIGEEVRGLTFRNNEGTAPAQEPLLAGNRFAVDPDRFAPLPPASSLNQGEFAGVRAYLARFENMAWDPLRIDPRTLVAPGAATDNEQKRLAATAAYYVQPLAGGMDPFLRKGALRGWRYMLVDEWGPYDFKRAILWPRGAAPDGGRLFEVLGPPGKAALADISGAALEAISADGRTWQYATEVAVPGWVKVRLNPGKAANIKLMFEYEGAATVDYRGIVTPKGKKVRFGHEKFFAPIDWTVRWYAWDKAAVLSPRDKMPPLSQLFSAQQLSKPLREEKNDRLDYSWGGSPGAGIPPDYFATIAEGSFEIAPGLYMLSVTSDDGVRVWLDDKLVLDQWKWQGPTLYTVDASLGGRHKLRVEHYEIDGYAALKVNLRPKK